MKILLIEDHAATRELVCRYLAEAGIQTEWAARCSTGRTRALEGDYDVLVLDRMLPDGDGLELCRELRAVGVSRPCLCLTARGEVGDRIEGLEAGADDYLRKPFALAELKARLHALTRRQGSEPVRVLDAGDVRIDFTARRLRSAAGEIALTDREWRLLEMLAGRAGRIVERSEILETLWPEAGAAGADSLDVILGRLRRKLALASPALAIHTVRGVGLRFDAPA